MTLHLNNKINFYFFLFLFISQCVVLGRVSLGSQLKSEPTTVLCLPFTFIFQSAFSRNFLLLPTLHVDLLKFHRLRKNQHHSQQLTQLEYNQKWILKNPNPLSICTWFFKISISRNGFLNLIFELDFWTRFLNLIFCLFRTWFLQATQAVKIKFEIDKRIKLKINTNRFPSLGW